MTIMEIIKAEEVNKVKEKNRMAALKAWETMRRQKIEKIKSEFESTSITILAFSSLVLYVPLPTIPSPHERERD